MTRIIMKICYVADGASIHTQRWVNYFAGKGHEVHLICWKLMPGYEGNVNIHLLTRLAPKIWAVSRYLSVLLWIFQTRRLVKKIKPLFDPASLSLIVNHVAGFYKALLASPPVFASYI